MKNQGAINSKQQLTSHNTIEIDTSHTDVCTELSPEAIKQQSDIPHQILSNKPQQQSAKSKKSSVSSGKDAPKILSSSSRITEMTSIELKRKKLNEASGSSSLPTKYIKLDTNTQIILEKILEEQLRQRITIETLQENHVELKNDILENHKLLQSMLTILTTGPLTAINEQTQQQEGRAKQRLKRKDTKHMWWDDPMTEACHRLFQVNKNPSDAEIKHAFKAQIQADHPKKCRIL